jgi:hypothetical protein
MNKPQIIELPKAEDPRGNLTFFQDDTQIPFKIERAFWTYDVPGGQVRGGHAFYKQKEFIVALSGSFDVVLLLPGGKTKTFHLNRSYFGLYLPPMTWRHMENFSTNALSFHVSDSLYSPDDYLRDKNEYLRLIEK